MNKLDIIGDYITPTKMIEIKYYKAKHICMHIWDNPKSIFDFEDIFHNTIYKCLQVLGNEKKEVEYLKKYFFKAFRINMIRYFQYSYNLTTSGKEIEKLIIPIDCEYSSHMDGFAMMDYVEKQHGNNIRNLLWDNLNGITYSELDNIYDVNSFYILRKVKEELKQYYRKDS